MQLAMGEAWTSRMQLVTDSRERMARLLNAANTREGLATPRSAGQVAVLAHIGYSFQLQSVASTILTVRGGGATSCYSGAGLRGFREDGLRL